MAASYAPCLFLRRSSCGDSCSMYYPEPSPASAISAIRGGGCDSADSGSGGRNEVGRIADPFSSSLGASSVRDRPLRELRRPVHSGRGPDKSARIGKTTQIVFLNDPSTRPESSELRRVDPQGHVRARARRFRSRPVPKARCPFGTVRVLLGISL